jgi:trk system potassium uptake protein TrkH
MAGVVALRAAGMSWFDAICHCFSAIGLGGFSTHDVSVGYFDSFAVELVLCAIMFVAALNFSRHFLAFRSMSFKPYATDSEGKAVLILLACSVLLVSALLALDGTYPTTMEGFRHSVFNVVSIATTTGFVTEDYEKWPAFLPVWLLFLSCSPAAPARPAAASRCFARCCWFASAPRLKLLCPERRDSIRIGGGAIPERVVNSVLAFIFLYFGTILVLTFAELATGLDLVSSFSAIVGSINNVGPGLGAVGPSTNFSALTDAQTWICTAAMLVGRLEIFSVLVLFTAHFWRK